MYIEAASERGAALCMYMAKTVALKGSKKLLNAWAFYDWANSVYTLTIASSIFPIYYATLFATSDERVSAFGFDMKPTVLISSVTAFTFFYCCHLVSLIIRYGGLCRE